MNLIRKNVADSTIVYICGYWVPRSLSNKENESQPIYSLKSLTKSRFASKEIDVNKITKVIDLNI